MTASNGTWKFVVWERLNKSGKWCPYSAEVTHFLESNFKRSVENVSLGEVEDDLKIYSVNLKDMVQVSEKTGTKSSVRRQLYSSIDSLHSSFTWQWGGSEEDSWTSYDIHINTFIEKAFQKGEKTVKLNKVFPKYNYEIDFKKMLQINRQTKRKRSIRRKKNTSFYPVQSVDGAASDTQQNEESAEVGSDACATVTDKAYPDLDQDVPGTSSLLDQLGSYVRSVTMGVTSTAGGSVNVPLPPARKKTKIQTVTMQSADNDPIPRSIPDSGATTYALVNGMPWYDSWPPYTPPFRLKPVPGIEPLPKTPQKTAKKKKNLVKEIIASDVFDLHTEEVSIDPSNEETLNELCSICYDSILKVSAYDGDNTVVKMKICSHTFHKGCIKAMYNNGSKDESLRCPTCKTIHGEKCGTQPPGEMIYHVLPYSLPSFHECDTIQILYHIAPGTQGPEHPRPGKKYTARAFPRSCYLPDNDMGRKVLRLLIKAWKRRLIFTVGRSATTGEENTVTWNEIHHKTEFGCNRRGHGYPDPNFFYNILAELEAHGVKDDEVYLWYPA